ncbi:uncharacterized protein LOC143301883 isoform X4 [Babylonia areolata]|uniref:uncharacterized protein LOC143301883 isoform X4 n=1 Tax=Babylonia areolata TaxID=304850 RepID=UPI003FCF5603
MADTMNFGPEWLRALSGDGPQSSGTSAAPSTKFKLADYRYGREEMLTLFQHRYEAPPELKNFPHIFVEETQKPIALMPLSEDEERLIAQGVNSQIVMRPGRGGPTSARGGRGGLMVDRGRARGGRGRGEVYSRGGLENGDIGGGFGRPRGPNKDGWEEVGNRKLERGFSRPFDEVGGREGHPRFSRSMSDNWRDKGPADDDDDSDWRKPVGRERWTTRTNWREPGRGGHDLERRDGGFLRSRGFDAEDRGRRLGEPRDSEDVPEWIDDGTEDVGSFDASGAFVSNREQPYLRDKKELKEDGLQGSGDPSQVDPEAVEMGPSQRREQEDWESSDSSQDINHTSNDPGSPSSHDNSKGDGGPVKEDDSEVSNGMSAPVPVVGATSLPLSLETMQDAASSAVAAVEEETPKISAPVVPITHENGLKWYYVDPQENLQGPFSSEDMVQWFNAGYFTMCLKVKRGCDHDFQPLGELMKQWGHVPFLPGPIHPPIVKPQQQTTVGPQEAAPSSSSSAATSTTPLPAASLTLPSPSPATPTPSFPLGQGAGGTESLLMQQQLLIQNQILQLQVELRQLQMQLLTQLQEQDSFKALDPAQQQQVSLHYIQSNPLLQQRLQQLQQLQHMQQQSQQTQQRLQLLSQAASMPVAAASAPVASLAVSSLPSLSQQQQPQQQPQQQHHSQPLPSSSSEGDLAPSSSPSSLPLPVSQPPPPAAGDGQGQGQGQGDIPSIWGSTPPAGGWPLGQPTSVWEVENNLPSVPVKPDLDKIRKEKEEVARMMEAERKQQEEIHKQKEELRRQAEALQREKEQMEREKEEMERQRILDLQRAEERRRQEEDQRRREVEEAQRRKQEEEAARRRQAEEQLRREEEQRRREEEAQQRRREEEAQRRREEERRIEEERRVQEAEWRKQEEIRRKREEEEAALQEMKRMEEARQQQEIETQRQRELEKQQEAEAAARKRELERQQQEALRRMQQQQALQNIQLPSTANWARQQQTPQSVQSRSLAEIQHEEELRQLQQEREIDMLQRQQQIQRQLEEQQLQQQQPQKTWASNLAAQQPPRVKTLAEIQEEQERQLKQEKQKAQQQQQYQAKSMSLSQAAVWGSGPGLTATQPSLSSSSSSSAPWSAPNSIWGAPTPASSLWGNGTSAPSSIKSPGKKAARENSSNSQISSEFPSLHSQKSNKSKQSAAKTTASTNSAQPSKSKKEEERVQRLFRETSESSKDEFTMWCEAFLEGMEVQVDIETFVSFLKEVDSPYEVHDYVKSYLGESKKAREFGKQFLEKRSHFNNKARKEKRQEEESIWGPAPAVNPREIRGNTVQTSNADHGFTEVGGKSKGAKKKKKMQKLDGSALLGFTVAKDPNRKNAGEIESID